MKSEVYSVRDSKVRDHMFLTLHLSEEGAVRWFGDLLKQKPFSLHPEDYTLWTVGMFDSTTGVIEGFPAREIFVSEAIRGKTA